MPEGIQHTTLVPLIGNVPDEINFKNVKKELISNFITLFDKVRPSATANVCCTAIKERPRFILPPATVYVNILLIQLTDSSGISYIVGRSEMIPLHNLF
jgi:hypothetical protein